MLEGVYEFSLSTVPFVGDEVFVAFGLSITMLLPLYNLYGYETHYVPVQVHYPKLQYSCFKYEQSAYSYSRHYNFLSNPGYRTP